MTNYTSFPRIADVPTALGPVTLAFTDADHVSVTVDAHINDDKPALVYRGQEYLAYVHLYAHRGWSVDPSVAPYVTRRPQWTDAPRTHAEAIVSAITDTVRAYVAEHPDVLRQAEYVDASNKLYQLERDATETADKLRDLRKAMRAERARMARNADGAS